MVFLKKKSGKIQAIYELYRNKKKRKFLILVKKCSTSNRSLKVFLIILIEFDPNCALKKINLVKPFITILYL